MMVVSEFIPGDVVVGGTVSLGSGPNRIRLISGTGSPEGVEDAPVGSAFFRVDGTPWVYIKESGGGGSTGWVAEIV